MGGALGTSGAAGIDSLISPVVGGGIFWLCLRLCDEPRETPLEVDAATGRAVLLSIVFDMAGAGCASTGRR